MERISLTPFLISKAKIFDLHGHTKGPRGVPCRVKVGPRRILDTSVDPDRFTMAFWCAGKEQVTYLRGQPIPQERQLLALLGPLDVPRAKEAIGEAARLGFAMETPRERAERIDLGLQKLKEADGSDKVTMAEYLAPLLRLLNMNVHDALMLTPGQTGDLLAQVTRKE